MTIKENTPLPELDKLIAEIKAGRRVLIFPPGIFLFVGIMVFTMIGLGGLIAVSGTMLNSFLSPETTIKLHLLCMLVATIMIVIAGIMISRGKKQYALLLKSIISILGVGYTGLTIYYFFAGESNKAYYLLIFSISAWLILYLTQRPTFTLFCEFFYRLKQAD